MSRINNAFTLYTKPACVQCDATKRWLTKRGWTAEDYTTVDVTAETSAADYLRSRGVMQMPAVIVSGPVVDELWTGYQPDKLAAHIGPRMVAAA